MSESEKASRSEVRRQNRAELESQIGTFPKIDEIEEEEGGHVTHAPISNLVWIGSNKLLAKYIARPIKRFMEIEASSGIFLILATLAALIWANSPWGSSYHTFWETELDISIGNVEIFANSLEHFVNDALMVFFFFVVGVEIKHEMVVGHLRNAREAAYPAIAALGGMLFPAIIFLIFNNSGPGMDGWAIPMATDIAFALGILALLGNRIPRTLRIFLLTLAVADDIGAILIIAIFYTEQLEVGWLLGAIGMCVLINLMRRARIWYVPIYFLLGAIVWWFTFKSGVHATIAGVALGFLTPAKPLQSQEEARKVSKWVQEKEHVYVADVRWANFNVAESVSMTSRIQAAMHPFVSYIIVPVFALANAGIEISSNSLREATTASVTLGVFLGLVVGKTAGVMLFSWLASALKLAKRPEGLNHMGLLGIALITGIGFTVAIFVSTLAFEKEEQVALLEQAKIGIFAASIVAAGLGLLVLHRAYKDLGAGMTDES